MVGRVQGISGSGGVVAAVNQGRNGEDLMLVVSREVGESIEVDNGNIEVFVVEVRGNKVRIGIKAPREIPVHRKEIAEKIRREAGEGG